MSNLVPLGYDVATVVAGDWARGFPEGGALWGTFAEFFRDDMRPRPHNPALAREYLERSVWNGESIQLTTQPGHSALAAEMVQLNLLAIGIDVEVEVLELIAFNDVWLYDPARDNHLAINFPSGTNFTALGGIRAAFLSGVSTNRMNINSPFVQAQYEALVEALLAHDIDLARELTYSIHAYLWEDIIAGVPLYHFVQGVTVVQGIGGIEIYDGHMVRMHMRNMYWDLNQTPEHLRP